jgi:subtilase family serine protease
LYTVPAGNTAVVKEIIVANNTGNNNATITLSIVPSGQTAGPLNRICAGKVVPANDVVVFALSTVMNAGDFISGLQGTNGALTVTISGVTQQ